MMVFLEELMAFLGRFHPILVHFPIGILVIAFVMAFLEFFKKENPYRPAIRLSLFLGSTAAVFAALSGFLLSRNGGYEIEVLNYHQWLGIVVAGCSILLYLLYREKSRELRWSRKIVRFRFGVFSLLVILLGITGHYGGTLTHGKGYFIEAMPQAMKKTFAVEESNEEILIVENVQQAFVYEGIIQPILKQRCQSCHGDRKKEGELALHTKESLLKGGENGKVLLANKSKESELYKRLILPAGDKKRMPPKGRTPISPDQIKLIAWWIDQGASFDKKVGQLTQSKEIAAILKKLETGQQDAPKVLYADFPKAPDLPKGKMDAWQAKGIKIIPVAKENNLVQVNAINYPQFNDKDLQDLLAIKENIVQLKLGHTAITDQALATIKSMPFVSRLHLENTKVSDNGLLQLKGLQKLVYLNLVGTKVTVNGLANLKDVPNLKNVYIYQAAGGNNVDLKVLQAKIHVDTGNYRLPFIATDTIKF
ncbi:DUF2231 domain-containing protein [Sphingobacterium sp.]|uniref:DUF2231 domain-containing protein n=1 Tax=Sphingobacterium sp. TaxID=341027 RepID=UPI0031D606B4